jgi:hypothetical protein
MNSNIIIELRQQDAIVVNANGDYECQMSKDVTVDAGDVVQLSKAFIDTVKEGDINIVDDLTLSIQSGVYINNWQALSGNFIDNQGTVIPCGNPLLVPPATPTFGAAPCFRRFIPYLGVPAGALTGYSNYTGYQYKINYSGDNEPSFTITYSYLDYMDRPQYFHTTFPALDRKVNQVYTDAFNIVAKTGSLTVISPSVSFFAEVGTTLLGPVGTAITNKVYSPFVFTTEIILPKGVYSPVQLSTYISEQLSQANLSANTQSQNMSESKFQFAITDFDDQRANPNGQIDPTTKLPVPLTEQTTFITDDGVFSYKYPTNNSSFIGTSQIALEYDATADKFNWTYLHQPMYDATTGNNISVRFLRKGLTPDADVVGIAENSGIYFNSLTAKNSNGTLVDFWEGLLGFDLNAICVGTSSTVTNKYGLTGIINLSEPLVSGVNTTSGYYGLDAGVIRGSTTWYNRQSVPASQSGISSTINNTNAIYAASTLDLLLNKFSHYVLMTDLGFQNNNYIGSTFSRNINGIISKYYAYGSYAFAESDAAIQYIHSGTPIQLKSVHVRLLKSNKKLDINLGDDNTIILQIIKGGQGLPAVSTPKSMKA